jgi:hypothetical protein
LWTAFDISPKACPMEISPNVIYYWIDRGVIQARRLNAGSLYWINETDE